MARERVPRGEILQAAYGVLDKYKMNRSFFVKTEQSNCETLAPPLEAVDPTNPTVEVKKIEESVVEPLESNEATPTKLLVTVEPETVEVDPESVKLDSVSLKIDPPTVKV